MVLGAGLTRRSAPAPRLRALVAGLVVLAAASSGCVLRADPLWDAVIEIDVPSPEMTVEEVVTVVWDAVRQAEETVGKRREFRVVRIVATTAHRVQAIHPAAAVDPAAGEEVVWAVLAEGTFVGLRGRQGRPIIFDEAFFVVSDADGLVIQFGSR